MSAIGARRAWARARRDGFPARFPSLCAKCHGGIDPGQRIVPVMGGGFAHTTCVSGQDEE